MYKILITGLLGGLMSWAGLVTDATADMFTPGTSQHICDTGSVHSGIAICSASANNTNTVFSEAEASFGSVSAYIQGGATGRGYTGAALATATFTETMTIFGGVGQSVLAIMESVVNYGTGSLDSGYADSHAYTQTVDQTFIFGTPFTFALSATSAGTFLGSDCDAGSFLVSKAITSLAVLGSNGQTFTNGITYTDASGTKYQMGSAQMTATPEPAAWGFGAIGLGLLWLGSWRIKRKTPQEVENKK